MRGEALTPGVAFGGVWCAVDQPRVSDRSGWRGEEPLEDGAAGCEDVGAECGWVVELGAEAAGEGPVEEVEVDDEVAGLGVLADPGALPGGGRAGDDRDGHGRWAWPGGDP